MPKTDNQLLTECYAATHEAADMVSRLVTAVDKPVGQGLPIDEARERLKELRLTLSGACALAISLEQRAAGVRPPKEG